MAVIITDNRTIPSEADATTGWTASAGVAVFTTNPTPVESTGSLGTQVSNALEDSYFTITSANLTNTLVYCWLLPQGVMDTTTNGGVQIYLGDGSNDRGYHVGGSDGAGFRHDDGPVLWQCFVIDTSTLPTATTNFVGAGAPNLTTITRIGNAFKTLVKSVGGVENCFMDLIAYGNGGLTITGGGTGTEGKFLEIAVRDRATTDHPGSGVASATGAAYGIIRELGADLYGLQGPLTFGNTGTGSVDFDDADVTVAFEDRGIGTDKYGLTVTGNGTGTTSVVWTECIFNCPAGVGAFFTATNTNVNTLTITGCTFLNYDQSFAFTTGANGSGYTITNNIFSGCARIGVGTASFTGNSMQSSVGTAAVLLTTPTNNINNSEFISSGTGHAIEIGTAGTYSFSGHSYSGYATTDGTTGNEVIYNNSGGAVTINVANSTGTISVRNGAGASTTIVNNVNNTVTVLDTDTNPVVGAVVAVYNSSTGAEIVNDETDVNGEVAFTSSGNLGIYVRVRKSTSGSTRYVPVETVGDTGSGLLLTVTLIEDLIASA